LPQLPSLISARKVLAHMFLGKAWTRRLAKGNKVKRKAKRAILLQALWNARFDQGNDDESSVEYILDAHCLRLANKDVSL
jgi:hypothetical protein